MLTVIFWIVIIGLIVWGVNTLPIPPIFKTVIYVLCAIWVVMLIASLLGVSLGAMPHR